MTYRQAPDYEVPPSRVVPGSSMQLYAERIQRGNYVTYSHFFNAKFLVEMCGAEENDIVRVDIRERTEYDEPSEHWGWESWDERDGEIRYCMIWPSFLQLDMCFPYGSKAATEAGQGRPVNLVVTEILT